MSGRLLTGTLLFLMLGLLSPLSAVQAENDPPPHSSSTQITAADEQPNDCRALLARIDEQERKLNQELRQIKRELAALNQRLEEPGLKEALAGVGFILGLLGLAAFAVARRRDRKSMET